MPFVTVDTLKQMTPAGWVDALVRNNAETIDEHVLPTVDAIITRLSGKQPPANAADTERNVKQCALWLFKYLILEYQSGISQDEIDKRRRDYERAESDLMAMQGVTNGPAFEVIQPASTSTKRAGDWP